MHKTPRIVGRVARISLTVATLALGLGASGLLPTPAKAAAPAYVDHTLNMSSDLRNTATVSHTVPAGDNRLLLVAVMIRANEWVSTVKYDSTYDLTLAKVQDGGGVDDQRVELWYLAGPPVGTANVVVTFASYVNPDGVVAVNLTGVDQNDPIGATGGSNASSGTQATTSITTLNDDSLIFGAASARSRNSSPFTTTYPPITELWDGTTGSDPDPLDDDGFWGGEREAAAGTYTLDTTLNVGDNWAIACVELNYFSAPSFTSITSDASSYKDGDTVTLTVTLDNNNAGCDLTADFSTIDDQHLAGDEDVTNWGTDGTDNNSDGHIDEPAEQGIYVITYLISTANTRSDGTYSVSVTAVDGGGNSASDTVDLTLDNTAPSAPTSLTATAIAGGNIQLAWTASPEADVAYYNIYKATTSGGQSYASSDYQVSAGTTTYTDTSTTSAVTYYYVVRAQDTTGNIETNTTEVSATAGIPTGPSFSSITADKSAYKDGDTITLTVTLANHNTGCTLTANFSNMDDQYVTGGESVENWGTDGTDNNGDGHTDEPAEQGVYVISYLISAVNGKADGSHSVPVTATDAASNSATSSISLTLDNTAPPAPTSLSATAISAGSIQLTWTASSPETDVSYYNIYRAATSGGQDFTSSLASVSAGTTTYTDTATTDGVTYYYVVRAQDVAGNIETNTNEVSATASGTGPPAPTNLTATAVAGGSILLTWTASSPETNVALYNIYRAATSGSQDFTSSLASVAAGTTTYTDTSTTDGVTYYYVVRAQDNVGNIETNTNEASATADATVPPPPSNLAATAIAGNGIQLTWTASSPETDVAQYNIYRATTSGGQNYSSPTYTVSVGTTSYTDTAVTDGVIYYYVARAQNAAGNIETNTNEVSATATVSGPSATVSQIYLEYGGEAIYDLSASTDSDDPTVFAKGRIDEVYVRLDLHSGFELSETSSSIALFKGVGESAEPVSGTQEINEGTDWAELVFHPDPALNPALDRHSRDDLYWVDVSAVSTTDTSNDFDFYFVYDTTSPEVPDFGISSFNSTTGAVSVSGSTESDASDPQELEIFLNGQSQGKVTADATGHFSKDNISLVTGDNFIIVQSTDKAGNKSTLSRSLHLNYDSRNLLSLVVRSSHVVRSGSATIPVRVIYSVTEPAEVAILVYNLHGEIVKEWSEWVSPGEEPEWSWFGDNMYGEMVNNGVYILKVTARDSGGRTDNATKLLGVLR